MLSSHSRGSDSSTEVMGSMIPALLISTSSRPNVSKAAATNRSTWDYR